MNSTLEIFAREKIKEGLGWLPVEWQRKFKLMYVPRNISIDTMDINDVVDKMPADKLDWALTQVENSIKKMVSQATKICSKE